MRLPHIESGSVVGRDTLDGGERVVAGDLDLAHVAHVEQTGSGADGHVLLDDAGVLDGHVPAAEGNHPGSGGAMTGIERRLLKGCGGGLFHAGRIA